MYGMGIECSIPRRSIPRTWRDVETQRECCHVEEAVFHVKRGVVSVRRLRRLLNHRYQTGLGGSSAGAQRRRDENTRIPRMFHVKLDAWFRYGAGGASSTTEGCAGERISGRSRGSRESARRSHPHRRAPRARSRGGTCGSVCPLPSPHSPHWRP